MTRKARPPGAGGDRAAADRAPGQRDQRSPKPAAEQKQDPAASPEHQFVVKGLGLLDKTDPQARRRAGLVRVRCGDPLLTALR
jgi:hypothetical protein